VWCFAFAQTSTFELIPSCLGLPEPGWQLVEIYGFPDTEMNTDDNNLNNWNGSFPCRTLNADRDSTDSATGADHQFDGRSYGPVHITAMSSITGLILNRLHWRDVTWRDCLDVRWPPYLKVHYAEVFRSRNLAALAKLVFLLRSA